MQWTGDNEAEIQSWTGKDGFYSVASENRDDGQVFTASLWVAANLTWLGIETGEWVLKDSGGFYPCKPDVFAATYDEIPSEEPPDV